MCSAAQYLYNMVPLVSGEQLYRAERISLRTLDSVYWYALLSIVTLPGVS